MTTIIEFLTARYDEDAATAQAIIGAGGSSGWEAHPIAELEGRRALTGGSWIFAVMDPVPEGPECADHIARHDPARVIREINAKRAVLELHTWSSGIDGCWSCSGDHGADPTPAPCDTLRHLAAVYSDHPDYRNEWAP